MATSDDEKIAAIVKNLEDRGQSRPRKLKTLSNTINTLFTKKLEESELSALIEELEATLHRRTRRQRELQAVQVA